MGVRGGVFWLDEAISGELKSAEIRCDGYKVGRKFVVLRDYTSAIDWQG